MFAGSYNTTFSNTLADPSAGLLQFDGSPDPFITGDKIYAYVKDGTPRPWYLFDISAWNGKDPIAFSGFYIGPGSISQISIFTSPRVLVRTPDGGATAALLGGAMIAMAAFRRKLLK
jgi:hypothetical protein